MSDKTQIEWTDATWNPVRGCARVSPGCEHCYAERLAARFSSPGQPYEGLATMVNGHPRWTGEIQLVAGAINLPLRWKTPRRVFVNSTSDLFHEAVPESFIDRCLYTIALARQHTFQILTKRPERMHALMSRPYPYAIHWCTPDGFTLPWPLPNLWLGVSVESADYLHRIDILRAIPTAVRFVSFEPLLGPIPTPDLSGIHWIIIGGESGPGARPMHPDWARELVSQGKLQGCAVFFKQWGEYGPAIDLPFATFEKHAVAVSPQGTIRDRHEPMGEGAAILVKLGKHQTGRILDGQEWNEFPDQAAMP
jgi:protein gp37